MPGTETQEYKNWSKNWTIAYEGGYIEAAYGNLVQTLDIGVVANACFDIPVAVVRKAHGRTNQIGSLSTPVAEARFTYNRYPKRNSSAAAGGALYTIHTDLGSYTARVGGDIQTFMAWACSQSKEFFTPISVQSSSGAWYGPIGNETPES